jgi:hypothetical protein
MVFVPIPDNFPPLGNNLGRECFSVLVGEQSMLPFHREGFLETYFEIITLCRTISCNLKHRAEELTKRYKLFPIPTTPVIV